MHQPQLYADVSRRIMRQRSSDVSKLVASLKSSWRRGVDGPVKVLDVGCGPGDFTAQDLLPRLTERLGSCRLVGVDNEASMVRHARDRYARPGVLSFHQLDIADPGLLEETQLWPEDEVAPFHKIFSYYCLHWVKDQRQAVENLFKLLSDEHGEAILVLVAKDGIAAANRSLARNPRWRDYLKDCEKYVWAYQDSVDPAQDFRQLMEETGFVVDSCVCETRFYDYKNEEEARDMLSSINPFLNRIPEEDRSDFVQDLFSECLKSKFLTKSRDNGLEYVGRGEALIVKAHKLKM